MQTIERVMIVALIRDMAAAGYRCAAFWDGEEYQMPRSPGRFKARPSADADALMGSYGHRQVPETFARPMTTAEALAAIDTVDTGTLHFTDQHRDTWGARGVMIVLGNGTDCFSDWHAPDGEKFTDIPMRISEAADDGTLTADPTDLVRALRALCNRLEHHGSIGIDNHMLRTEYDAARAALAPYGG